MGRYIGGMSRAGILLRVVLGLSLVLNGIAGSLAVTTMGAASLGSHFSTPVERSAPPEHAGCHDHAAAPHHQSATPGNDPAPKAPTDPSDCCGGGLCGCACAHLSSLAAIDVLFVPPTLDHEHLSDAVAPARASPALPHLIRPPIA
jgi:hypothetical protein